MGTAGALIFFLSAHWAHWGTHMAATRWMLWDYLEASFGLLCDHYHMYHLVTTGNTLGLLEDYLVNIVGAYLCPVVVVVDVNFYSFCFSEVGYVWRRLSWQAGTLSKRKKADEEGRRLCTCAQQIVRGLNPCQVEKTRSILWVVWFKA